MSCQNIYEALCYLDNIFTKFCSELYRQIVGVTMGINYASTVVFVLL